MTKIILGTSKLGWDLSKNNYNDQIKTIEFFLKKNFQIHVSASYGYSLNRIRKIKILNKSRSSFLLKISFENPESFLHELIYSSMMIGKNKIIDIQIDEFFQPKNLPSLLKTLKNIQYLINYNKIFFTPITESQKKFLNKKFSQFGLTIHYSLVERSVSNNFLSNKKRSKIIALRGLGKGLRNFTFEDFYLNKSKKKLNNLDNILFKFKMSEIEARALYIFNNKAIDKVVLSTSKLKNLAQLLKLEKNKLEIKKWRILEKYSKDNFEHKKMRLPKNQNSFIKRHNAIIFCQKLLLLQILQVQKHLLFYKKH